MMLLWLIAPSPISTASQWTWGETADAIASGKRDRPYKIPPDEPTGVTRDHDRVRKAYKIVSK
jgi:hypothetical protein